MIRAIHITHSCARAAIAAMAVIAMDSNVVAQRYSGAGVPGVPPLLQRVDPTFGDVSPLGESLRDVDMQMDLRSPSGFTNVYRVPGRDDLLMRASGGTYAIFSQSVYVPVKSGGSAALIPPGTVFSIGVPSRWSMPSQWVRGPEIQPMTAADVGSRQAIPAEARKPWAGAPPIDSRARHRRGALTDDVAWTSEGAPPLHPGDVDQGTLENQPRVRRARATPPEPSTFLKTVVTDDDYRVARLTELMERAMQAARGVDR